MFDVLLVACLTDDPGVCREERIMGGATAGACAAAAEIAVEALPPGWTAQEWPCVVAGASPDFRVTEVAAGVFVHRGVHEEPSASNRGDVSNLGFVTGEQAVAAIDAGGSPAVARAMLDEIRERTGKPVRWLILTHMHPDHVLGAEAFVEAGAQPIGHHRLPAALSARRESYLESMRRALGPSFEDVEIVMPEDLVEGRRELDLGGRVLELEAHPVAHTDNDLTVYDRETGTWFLGDLLFMGHTPAVDGSLLGWRGLMDELTVRPAERVVPGHGPVAAEWPEAAAPQIAYLDALIADARAAVEEGTPMLQAIDEIAEDQRDRWALFDVYNPRNATAAYQQMEWE